MSHPTVSGIEDKDDWHGKPLGDQAQAAIQALKDNIANQGPHDLLPSTPEEEVPEVNVSNIKLSEEPQYQLQQQVCLWLLSMYHYFESLKIIYLQKSYLAVLP